MGREGVEDQIHHREVTSQNQCLTHGANHEENTELRWMETIGTMCGTGG